MNNLDFIRKLYNGKNCYSDHMTKDELNLIHINSEVENIILRLLKANKILFLTGNPGDGKTFLIQAHADEIRKIGAYIETDLNRIANYEEVAEKIIKSYQKKKAAIIAVNEYQFYQLCKIIKKLAIDIYNEIMQIKQNCIIYDLNKGELKRIAIIDLNERNLLDSDRALTSEIIDKVFNLLKDEKTHNSQLKKNLAAFEKPEVKKQFINLISLAATTCEHFAIRDILGAISFSLTACTTDEYEDMPYYDAIFDGGNKLIQTIRQFDPVYLSNPNLDEALWNGEIKEGWGLDVPLEWPNDSRFDENIEEAVKCFKSIKRKYYFEHENGEQLSEQQPDEIKRCMDIFTKFEDKNRQIKEKIIRSINKLFLPTSDDKRHLRIWTTHRYDFSTDISTAVSSCYVDAERLELKMPRPNEWLEGIEYVPNHIILKPKNYSKPELILDVDFLRTLDAVENGYPVGLLAPQYEQTCARFLRQLYDEELSEGNDDGEIIVASRKKSYQKLIYISDNKYSFEEVE